MKNLDVLYEDNHVIAVLKPAGVPIQTEAKGRETLLDQVKQYLKEKYQKPGNVFLGLLHRLDQPVSGVILFAKTSKGAARLSEQFRNHEVVKTYYALVEGKLKDRKGTLIHYLKKDEEQKRALISETLVEGYQNAELEYEVVEEGKENSILKINLKTGRYHQIRSQFSAIGHPIVGDIKYGAKKSFQDGHIALCATELKFKTATTDEEINLEIPYPEDWNKKSA